MGADNGHATPPARPAKVTIVIELDVEAGTIHAQGPVHNRLLLLGLLEAGGDLLKAQCDAAIDAARPRIMAPHGVMPGPLKL